MNIKILNLFFLLFRCVCPAYQEYTVNWELEFESYSHPRVYNSEEQVVILAPGQNNRVIVIDKSTGKLLWEQNVGTTSTDVAPPVFENGKLFLLAQKTLDVWGLETGNLLQTFDFEDFDLHFNYNQPPTFWNNKDSIVLETLDSNILRIGEQIYLFSEEPIIALDTSILWMQKIAPTELKNYELTNFKQLSPYWYNLEDSVYIDWRRFGLPFAVTSDSQIIIQNNEIQLSQWNFRKDSVEWGHTLKASDFENLVYSKIDGQNLWVLWKASMPSSHLILRQIDLETGETLDGSQSSTLVSKRLQHQASFSFIANYQEIFWVDYTESENYPFHK